MFPEDVLTAKGDWTGQPADLKGYTERCVKILQKWIPENSPGLMTSTGWVRLQDFLNLQEVMSWRMGVADPVTGKFE
eukprot:11855113-Heterocapsa_arctica.AAC.2